MQKKGTYGANKKLLKKERSKKNDRGGWSLNFTIPPTPDFLKIQLL